jgi:hypothetical protein
MSNPYRIKLCCYWELIEKLKNVIGNMLGTHWEHGGNTKKKISIHTPPPFPPGKK